MEVAYEHGLFDKMNKVLNDPLHDTKGFFDPNLEENLSYLQLMEHCVPDTQTGLCFLSLKEKKQEQMSSKSSAFKCHLMIMDPEAGKEISAYKADCKGLIEHQM